MQCSFCTAPAGAVEILVHGPGVQICDRCVRLCNDVLAERRSEVGGERPGCEDGLGSDECYGGAPGMSIFARSSPVELDAEARIRLTRAESIARELVAVLGELLGASEQR